MWDSRDESLGVPLRGGPGPVASGIRVRIQKKTVMNKGVAVDRTQLGVGLRLFRAIMFALPFVFPALGAAPPEIIRVHIPDGQAASWFPAGTPLRMMAPERFESLLDSAIRGTSPTRLANPPRLIRARRPRPLERGSADG